MLLPKLLQQVFIFSRARRITVAFHQSPMTKQIWKDSKEGSFPPVLGYISRGLNLLEIMALQSVRSIGVSSISLKNLKVPSRSWTNFFLEPSEATISSEIIHKWRPHVALVTKKHRSKKKKWFRFKQYWYNSFKMQCDCLNLNYRYIFFPYYFCRGHN